VKGKTRFRITGAMAARMLADALMINAALVSALAIRFLLKVAMHRQARAIGYEEELASYVTAYLHNAWILTGVCLVVFTVCGFYTYGRVYQNRYKALVITQAVLHSYLILGFVSHVFWDKLGLLEIPRVALLLALLLNLGLTLASRSWSFVWERVIRPEREARIQNGNGDRVRNVLVIGGAGYIGSALLPKLLEQGYRVRVLDLFLYGEEPIRAVADHARLELVTGDFRDVQKVVEATRGMDAVVHLGAIVGDPACSLDEDVTVDVNLGATQMIAQVAKASGIRRFVFASTCSVYGACDEILDERSDVKPVSLYGHTKLVAERGLRSMADERFAPTILRFATIYGLSGRTRFDLVVNVLAAKAKVDGQITIHGGNQWRPFVHVDDAARAVLKMITSPLSLVGNETFNVGSDEQNYTIQEIGELIQQQVFTAELICEDSATDHRNYRVSFRRIRNKLGFEPRWTVEQGVQQVLEAVAGGDVLDYRDPRYSNARFLSESGVINIIKADEDWTRELLKPQPSPEYAN